MNQTGKKLLILFTVAAAFLTCGCVRQNLASPEQPAGALELSAPAQVKNEAEAKKSAELLTGEISGMVGFDSLTLTGKDLSIRDPDAAMKKAIEVSKETAAQGAIITLVAHMPNFGSSNIKWENGKWYFGNCPLSDARDLSGETGKKLLY